MRRPLELVVPATLLLAAPSAALAGDIGSTLVSIGVPAIIFSFVLAVVWGAFFVGYRETRERQETLRLAIEKGVAIPPELVAGAKGESSPEKDLRSGVRLVFVGIGVGVLLWFVAPYRNVWAVGAMLVIFGLGQIVASRVGRAARRPGPVPPSDASA
jgi:hypothetical protein